MPEPSPAARPKVRRSQAARRQPRRPAAGCSRTAARTGPLPPRTQPASTPARTRGPPPAGPALARSPPGGRCRPGSGGRGSPTAPDDQRRHPPQRPRAPVPPRSRHHARAPPIPPGGTGRSARRAAPPWCSTVPAAEHRSAGWTGRRRPVVPHRCYGRSSIADGPPGSARVRPRPPVGDPRPPVGDPHDHNPRPTTPSAPRTDHPNGSPTP